MFDSKLVQKHFIDPRKSSLYGFLGGLCLLALLAGCGGGAGGDGGAGASGCTGNCGAASPQALSVAEVQQVVRQAVHEATTRGFPATVAVVDRVGNVLAVFRMTGAAPTFTITSNGNQPAGRNVSGGLENVSIVASEYAAISKAITGAYLSSEGNAFTTRTASQIVQENFNPGPPPTGEPGQPGGPLFGVQFSSLSCSDVTRTAAMGTAGPKGAPLGLAADTGGLPLYKNGTVVGGVGIIADAIYSLDIDINTEDAHIDELIAVAGARGFDAPIDRRGDRIAVDGRFLRYVDSEATISNPATAPAFAALPGALIAVPGYYPGVAALGGTAFSTPASGIRPDNNPAFAGLNAYVLDDGAGTNRYPPIAGSADPSLGGAAPLTAAEVTQILAAAIRVANRARAQIRRPLGSTAQVTMSVVDSNGVIVGLIRTPDAPVFGTDVSVQKARTALLFSHPNAGAEISAQPLAFYPTPPTFSPPSQYVANMRAFLNPGALMDGIAYTPRAVGNLARPFFPDGINPNGQGPLSKPFAQWSPFNDGLQLDLVINKVVGNILAGAPTPPCTGLMRARNGIQIFPGGAPIYRSGILVGGIGISGDGIDQDDMIAFLGLGNAGAALGTIGHAPANRRADTVTTPTGDFLRYVNCPIAPFIDSTETNVCNF